MPADAGLRLGRFFFAAPGLSRGAYAAAREAWRLQPKPEAPCPTRRSLRVRARVAGGVLDHDRRGSVPRRRGRGDSRATGRRAEEVHRQVARRDSNRLRRDERAVGQLHAILANPELIKLFASEDNSAAAAAAQQQPSSSSSSSSPAPAPASAVAAAGVPDDDTDLARLQAVVKKLRVRYQANENPDDDAFKHPLVEPFHSTRDVDDFIRSHLNTPVAQLATWRWDDQYPEQAIAVLLDVSRGVTQHLEQLYAQAREQAIYRGREFHRRQHLKNSNYDVRLVIGACATHARALDKAYKEGNFDVEEPHFLFRELQEYLAWLNGPTAEAVGEFLSLEKLEHDRDDKAAQEDAKNAAAEAAAEAAAAAIADPVAHAQETAVARLSSRQLSLYDISNIHWLYEEHTRYKNTRPRDLNEAALKERTRFYKLYQPALDYYESNPAAKEAAIAEGDEVHRKFADSLVGCDVKYYQKHREDPVYDHWSTYKKTVANWGASRAIVPPKDKFNVDDDHPAPAGSS